MVRKIAKCKKCTWRNLSVKETPCIWCITNRKKLEGFDPKPDGKRIAKIRARKWYKIYEKIWNMLRERGCDVDSKVMWYLWHVLDDHYAFSSASGAWYAKESMVIFLDDEEVRGL